MSVETALREAKRLKREREAQDQPVVALVSGDPESTRILGRQMSAREAMIGDQLCEAEPNEGLRQFHRRMVAIARERRIKSGVTRGVAIVSIGDDEEQPVCRFDAEGKLIEPPDLAPETLH